MASFFANLFSGKQPEPAFNLGQSASNFISQLSQCTASVVIASPQYASQYKCEVIVATTKLAPFVSSVCQATSGGNRDQQIARTAFPVWLRNANLEIRRSCYLPIGFTEIVNPYILNFVTDGAAHIFCVECDSVVTNVTMNKSNESHSGPYSNWSDEWLCPKGHHLYSEDQEIHWNWQK